MSQHFIVYLSLVNIIASFWYSIIAPILPLELEDHHVAEIWNGVIIGIYALSDIVTSLLVPYTLQKYNKKSMIVFAMGLMGISIGCFAVVMFLTEPWMILTFWIVLRIIQGWAASIIDWMAFAIVALVYKDNQVKYLGIMESTMGIGVMMGPLIGNLLYNIVGFKLTFVIVGIIIVLWSGMVYKFMPSIVSDYSEKTAIKDGSEEAFLWNINEESSDMTQENTLDSDVEQITQKPSNEKVTHQRECGYCDALSDKTIVMLTLWCFYSNIVYWFQEPILSLRLENDFNLNEFMIGLIFMISAFSYVFSSILIPFLIKSENYVRITEIATVWCGVSMILVGPSKLLPDSLVIMGIGQFIYVFFAVGMYLYCLPEIIARLTVKFPKQTNRVTDIATSFWVFSFALGQLIGPLLGSFLVNMFDFRICCDIIGVFWLLLGAVFLIINFR